MMSCELAESLALALDISLDRETGSDHMTAEKLLLALTSSPVLAEIFAACEADVDDLARTLEQYLEETVPTLGVADDRHERAPGRILDRAKAHAENSGVKEFNSGHMLVALFAENETFAGSELNRQGVTRRDVVNYMSHGSSRSKPTHPGEHVRDNMEAEDWTVAECASKLGVSQTTLSRLFKGRTGVSSSIALALERIGWCTADHWVHMQASYDLACERQRQAAALTIAQSSHNPPDKLTNPILRAR